MSTFQIDFPGTPGHCYPNAHCRNDYKKAIFRFNAHH